MKQHTLVHPINFARKISPSLQQIPTRRMLSCATGLLTLWLSGCASYTHVARFPDTGKPVSASINPMPLSSWSDLPLGVYKDDAHRIVVSGHQKGLGWGMLFGVAGVMIANEANKSSAHDRFGGATAASTTDVVALAREILPGEVAKEGLPTAPSGGQSVIVQLSPYAIFTVRKSGKAQLSASIRADAFGADGKPRWSTRYFAPAPDEYPLSATDDGWMTHDRYAEGMKVALIRAIDLCLEDMEGKLTAIRGAKIKGPFPFLNSDSMEFRGVIVRDDRDSVVVRLAVGDVIVFSGTHFLKRADYEFKDADVKDPQAP